MFVQQRQGGNYIRVKMLSKSLVTMMSVYVVQHKYYYPRVWICDKVFCLEIWLIHAKEFQSISLRLSLLDKLPKELLVQHWARSLQ